METIEVSPDTKLEQLLKLAGVASTGGEAKLLIQAGEVTVNGEVEQRRGYKVKEGDIVEVDDMSLKVSLK